MYIYMCMFMCVHVCVPVCMYMCVWRPELTCGAFFSLFTTYFIFYMGFSVTQELVDSVSGASWQASGL